MNVKDITSEQMEEATRELAEETGVEHILSIPGVWEHVSEYFNNGAIDRIRGAEPDADCARCSEDIGDSDAEADGYGAVCADCHTIISAMEHTANLSRERCVELLEAVSIECRDDESTVTLREAVESNLDDETIDAAEVLGLEEGVSG